MISNHVHGSGATPEGGIPTRTGGELAISFIGTGSAFSKKYFQNNVLVAKGEEHVLIDCGTRTPEALGLLGLSVTQINTYLITHTHADHIGGLEEVMLLNRYGPRKKPSIIVTEKMEKILWGMSLRGGAAYNEVHDGKALEFKDFWETIRPQRVRGGERELCEAKLGGLELRLFRTMHIPDSAKGWEDSFLSYGVLIDRRVLFTSDSRYDPELILSMDKEYSLEVIFHDCQLFTGGVHASLDELSALPASIKAKTLLMHYGDKGEEAREKALSLGFAGLAEQWKTYSFP